MGQFSRKRERLGSRIGLSYFVGLKNQCQSVADVKSTAIEESEFTIGSKTDRNDNNRRRQIHSFRQSSVGLEFFRPGNSKYRHIARIAKIFID